MLFEKTYLTLIRKKQRETQILGKSNSRLDVQSIFDLNDLLKRRNEELWFFPLRLNLGVGSVCRFFLKYAACIAPISPTIQFFLKIRTYTLALNSWPYSYTSSLLLFGLVWGSKLHQILDKMASPRTPELFFHKYKTQCGNAIQVNGELFGLKYRHLIFFLL